MKIGVVAIKCFRPYPLDEVREALRDAQRIVVIEKAFAVGAGGIVGQNVRLALSGLESRVHDVVAGLGGRPITKRSLHALFADVLADRLEPGPPALPRPEARRRRARARAHAGRRAAGAARREHPPRPRNRRRGLALRSAASVAEQQIKHYQVGTFVVGNRLLDPEQRSVQARMERSNTLTSGHRACQGCGEALGARYTLDAAMRATGGKLIAANATGCLEVFSTPFPGVVVAASLDPLAVRQRAGGRRRRRRGAEGQGPRGRPGGRAGRRRRHRRHRLRLPLGDVRARRRRALRLLRQRGLHEHRRAALRRHARRPPARPTRSRSATSPATSSARARTSR